MVSVLSENKRKTRRRYQQTKRQQRRQRYSTGQRKIIQPSKYCYPDECEYKKLSSFEIFYSIYRGWYVDYTACFLHPIYAIVWMRWMMWKDHILHLWKGELKFPKLRIIIDKTN